MNDDNTEEPALPVPTESTPIPVDFVFPFGERIRSGLVLNLVLAEARRRGYPALSGVPDWSGEWRSAASHEWHFYLNHRTFNSQVVITFEGKSPRITVITMLAPALEPFDTALTRAVHGSETAIPDLVKPCIETFGLIPIEGGYARTKGKPDDPDSFLYPMRDFIRGYDEKYKLLQQRAIGDLVAAFALTFDRWAKTNRVAKALQQVATTASMNTTQGYRVVLEAPCTSLACCDQIIRITQQNGFLTSPPEWVNSDCERIHVRWQKDPSGYAHLVATFFVYRVAASAARIEVDVPAVDTLTPRFVRTIEEIRDTLGSVDFRAEILNGEVSLESLPHTDFGKALGSELPESRNVPEEEQTASSPDEIPGESIFHTIGTDERMLIEKKLHLDADGGNLAAKRRLALLEVLRTDPQSFHLATAETLAGRLTLAGVAANRYNIKDDFQWIAENLGIKRERLARKHKL